MESKDIAEKPRKTKGGKSMIIKSLPHSVHKKIQRHQYNMNGRPTIDEAAVDLIVRGLNSVISRPNKTKPLRPVPAT